MGHVSLFFSIASHMSHLCMYSLASLPRTLVKEQDCFLRSDAKCSDR